jgi:hypothetical protein
MMLILVFHLSLIDFILFLAKVTSCDHAFCKTCLIDYSAALGNVSCPSCSIPLTVDLTTQNSAGKLTRSVKGRKCSGILSRLPSLVDFKTSTKIDALVSQTVAIVSYCTSLCLIVLWCHVFYAQIQWTKPNTVIFRHSESWSYLNICLHVLYGTQQT